MKGTMNMGKEKQKVSTTLEMDKECKTSARFRSADVDEEVTTSIYLLNASWKKFGKPTKVKVTVTPIE